MSEAWQNKIVTMIYVKEELMKQDTNKILPHFFPEVAADEVDLINAEINLGYAIDSQYADFLRAANGWKGFYHTVDLFGTEELSNPHIMQYIFSLLDAVEDCVIESSGFQREDLLPIAATRFDKDLFVITKQTASKPGIIIWFAGEEVDRYPNFEEFFLAMIDYNRLTIQKLSE